VAKIPLLVFIKLRKLLTIKNTNYNLWFWFIWTI